MDEPVVLQTGPETFRILFAGGRQVTATLPHQLRRGLGLHGVPPRAVAAEIVAFLLEQEGPDGCLAADGEVALDRAAGRHPAFLDELRARLASEGGG